MRPPVVRRLLECTTFIRTQCTLDVLLGGCQHALATQPLALGYEWNAVTLLMHSDIAPVTKYYGISLLSFTILANRAQRIVHRLVVVAVGSVHSVVLGQVKVQLLHLVHDELKVVHHQLHVQGSTLAKIDEPQSVLFIH